MNLVQKFSSNVQFQVNEKVYVLYILCGCMKDVWGGEWMKARETRQGSRLMVVWAAV